MSVIDMNAINKMLSAMEKGLNEATEHLKTEKVTPVTPIDTGELRQGTRVIQSKGHNMESFIGVSSVGHAIEVHETNKNYKEPGTAWKYLENPAKTYGGELITKAVEMELKKNGF